MKPKKKMKSAENATNNNNNNHHTNVLSYDEMLAAVDQSPYAQQAALLRDLVRKLKCL